MSEASPVERHEQRTKADDILDAARTLLKSGPYESLTVMAVCEVAGVSRPTFYAYFQDRKHLMLELCERTNAQLYRVGLAHTRASDTDFAKIVASNAAFVTVWARNAEVMVAYTPLAFVDPDFAAVRERYLKMGETRIEAKIRKLIETGEIPERDPRLLTQSLASMIEGFCLRYFSTDRAPEELEQEFPSILKALSEAWYAAVYCKEPPRDYPYEMYRLFGRNGVG
jgi:AcrR family transcriptional regulator